MDARMEAELRMVNRRLVEMAVHMAHHDLQPIPAVIEQLRDEWKRLDEGACELLAQRPCLLADFRFGDHAWWECIENGIDKNAVSHWQSNFPRPAAVDLSQQVLTMAWHAASGRAMKATIRLGLSVPVTQIISRIRFEDLVRIAEVHVGTLRLRWDARTVFWKAMINAAHVGDQQALQRSDLHGAQLLVRDLTLGMK